MEVNHHIFFRKTDEPLLYIYLVRSGIHFKDDEHCSFDILESNPHNEETVVKPSERILARNEKHLQIVSGRQGSAEGRFPAEGWRNSCSAGRKRRR